MEIMEGVKVMRKAMIRGAIVFDVVKIAMMWAWKVEEE